LFRKYYLPAGVSMNWLKRIAPMIKEALWQTGGDLISAKTGIVIYIYIYIYICVVRQNRAGRGGSKSPAGVNRGLCPND
jgi:hypothetical protein